MIKGLQKKYIIITFIVIAIVAISTVIFNKEGFVFSGPYIVKGGELTIEKALPNSTVFIENKKVGVTNSKGSASFKRIGLGSKSILVYHKDTWPWVFEFESKSNKVVIVRPLQVNMVTDGTVLKDKLRKFAEKELNNYREPTQSNPIKRNNVRIWVVGTTIYKQKGSDVKTVFVSQNPIRNVFWYGDRNDILIITTLNNVFALDIRKNKIQNFQPIYTGISPEAVANPKKIDKIFVRDGNQYLSVSI